MASLKRYLFLVLLVLCTTSFTHKDLNEYGKWLKFHGLEKSHFQQSGTEQSEAFEWTFSDRPDIPRTVYYSPDSAYLIDLFPVYYDRDSNLFPNPHFNSAHIVRTEDSFASTLLSMGSGTGYTETALWRNKNLFEIFGFRIMNKLFIPTVWKYDLENKTCNVFESKKTFKKRPQPYMP